MDRARSVSAARAIISSLLFLGFLLPGEAGRTDLLPDLVVALLADFWVDESPIGGRFLRFTASVLNAGNGPFALHGRRQASEDSTMNVTQTIQALEGPPRNLPVASVMEFAGDGHMHWHARRMMTYEL